LDVPSKIFPDESGLLSEIDAKAKNRKSLKEYLLLNYWVDFDKIKHKWSLDVPL
jgi:predicted transcriptional regulator